MTHGNDIARTSSGTKDGKMLCAGICDMELNGGVPEVFEGLNFTKMTPSSLLLRVSALTSMASLVNGRVAMTRVSILCVLTSIHEHVPATTLIPVPRGSLKTLFGGRTTSDILRADTSRNSISVAKCVLPARTTRKLTSSSSFWARMPVER